MGKVTTENSPNSSQKTFNFTYQIYIILTSKLLTIKYYKLHFKVLNFYFETEIQNFDTLTEIVPARASRSSSSFPILTSFQGSLYCSLRMKSLEKL